MAKVLIVDDDVSMTGLLRTLFEIEGFAVATEARPDKVIDTILLEKPHILLMDVNLRGGNGLEILREIRADRRVRRIPVVMSSGMDVEDECRQANANAFIMKPYMPASLIDLMKETMASAARPASS